MPFINETIERWNARTQNMSGLLQKGQKKAFHKTILEQVQDVMGDEEMLKKAIMKSQLKRETYRILGSTDAEEALKMSDLNLFNDHDYYQLLLNDFLSMNDKQAETTDTKDGNEFLYGADLSLTQKYLIKRQKLKEL